MRLAAKRRTTNPTPYTSKLAPEEGIFATEWTREENHLFENLIAQDDHPEVPPRNPTRHPPLRDPSHDNPRCACPVAIQDRPCEYFEIFINLDPQTTDAQPDAELTAILDETAQTMSRDSGHTINITSSGRILVDGQDPGNSKEILEWVALYKPHGDTCHCKANPPANIARKDCPNPIPCRCHHLPGPITNTITSEGNVVITKHPPAA